MELRYIEGLLEPRIQEQTLGEVEDQLTYNHRRLWLFEGIVKTVADLQRIACQVIYLGGDFATQQQLPRGFVLCWDDTGVDMELAAQICPELFEWAWGRRKIKERYRGDVVPACAYPGTLNVTDILRWFIDPQDDMEKGIIKISIR